MKKYGLPILIVLVIVFAGYKLFVNKNSSKSDEKQKPLAMGANSGPFNQSFTSLLNAYYSLKDALVANDTAKATAAALELAVQTEKLNIKELNGDSTGTIKQTASFYTGSIGPMVSNLAGEKTLAGKRKQFEEISDAVWSLTRTVRYDGQKVFYLYCPMAFDNKGAYWLSSDKEIHNPYFGDKMPNCGEVADSVDYSRKK